MEIIQYQERVVAGISHVVSSVEFYEAFLVLPNGALVRGAVGFVVVEGDGDLCEREGEVDGGR